MLGMFCNDYQRGEYHLVPTTAFLSHHAELGGRRVLDARHGRVLLRGEGWALVVWDPITDEEWKVPFPPQCTGVFGWTATVLCSVAAGGAGSCDHLDCQRRPFVVVVVASFPIGYDAGKTVIYTYSSNAAVWSDPACIQRPSYHVDITVRSALVGNTLYFGNMLENTILKYNMQSRQMSWIQLPPSVLHHRLCALTTTEDGGLQFSIEDEEKLYIWSTKDADEVDARWERNRAIELDMLLSDDADFIVLDVVGSTDGLGAIFVSAGNVTYAIDLKTYKVEKVYEGTVDTIIPYLSFYTPELEVASTGEEPSAGGSNA